LLALTPFISGTQIATAGTISGNIDWACASAAHTTASAQSMGAAVAGTILTKYVPTNCK
jgi:type IV pilus assembly protein PilA